MERYADGITPRETWSTGIIQWAVVAIISIIITIAIAIIGKQGLFLHFWSCYAETR